MADTEKFNRACERLESAALFNLIDKQTDLVHYRNVGRFAEGSRGDELRVNTNDEVWEYFVREDIYDTKRLVLEQFHLFEWFPLAPGKFHTDGASHARKYALQYLEQADEEQAYYNPMGKGLMIEGGIGNVRLLSRTINGEPHYFMTASSTGVCHEGFPVLLPRRFYGDLKARIQLDGAVPVRLRGEMRYLPDELKTLFGSNRNIPLLYLHVDERPEPTAPRREVTNHEVSVAVSFKGKFQGEEGTYATFATFDPAVRGDKQRACQWIEHFYVTKKYQGVVLTDFDETHPNFPKGRLPMRLGRLLAAKKHQTPKAEFALGDLMSGEFDLNEATAALPKYVLDAGQISIFIQNYNRQIHTEGGAYVEGDVKTGGGKFVSRDDK
jgi:hypothetical protein